MTAMPSMCLGRVLYHYSTNVTILTTIRYARNVVRITANVYQSMKKSSIYTLSMFKCRLPQSQKVADRPEVREASLLEEDRNQSVEVEYILQILGAVRGASSQDCTFACLQAVPPLAGA